jgi:hypothetical protein
MGLKLKCSIPVIAAPECFVVLVPLLLDPQLLEHGLVCNCVPAGPRGVAGCYEHKYEYLTDMGVALLEGLLSQHCYRGQRRRAAIRRRDAESFDLN